MATYWDEKGALVVCGIALGMVSRCRPCAAFPGLPVTVSGQEGLACHSSHPSPLHVIIIRGEEFRAGCHTLVLSHYRQSRVMLRHT